MKITGEIEYEKDNDDDIILLVNLFETLKEINKKIEKLEHICTELGKAIAEGDPHD